MKVPFLSSLAVLLLGASCQSSQAINDHWNPQSTVPSIQRTFLGYDGSRDGSYRDFAWERKQSINLTVRRHFLNHNPDNPNHPELESRFDPRPVNSIMPNPITFIHLEGLLLGFATLGVGGVYIPLPLDSIGGVFEDANDGQESGLDEFMRGIASTGDGLIGVISASFVDNVIEPPVQGVLVRINRIID